MPDSTLSIREIVSAHPSAATVLQRFEIDLCGQAGDSLVRACEELQLSVDQVLEKLSDAEAAERGTGQANAATFSTGRLIRHIVRVHHQRLRQELPRLAEMAHKLAGKQSDRAPQLRSVLALIEKLSADLFAHIQKEEQILFPFISQMEQESNAANPVARACFRSVAQPISMMMQEHKSAGRAVAEIRRLTDGFEPPSWACAAHIALYGGLREFQTELKQHVHLEDDVLFPRAIEMEAALNHRS